MLECRACLLRSIRAIANETLPPTLRCPPLLLTPRLRIPALSSRRLATTVNATRTSERSSENGKEEVQETLAVAHTQSDLKRELTWLQDPAKLAQHVHYTLRQQNPEKALDLCRLASKSMNCVVGWNYVLDWMMKSGRVNEALRIYNEMKKRGQYPDSYTYMQLLRGFPQKAFSAKSEVLEQNVPKAVSIYTSMTSPTSRVKPSIMHTNAALRVCSIARDMDALWNVASKIPEDGPAAADHRTYSILLGAIQHGAFGKGTDAHTEDVPVERIQELRQQAVNEGRRIWQEVVDKWRDGKVMIDESLVVAMANLLIFGKRMEDWDDVLNLVQQTTKIERLIPPLGHPERQTGHVPLTDHVDPQTTVAEDSEGWIPTPATHAFKPITAKKPDPENPRRATSIAYVQAGNGILNVLMQACTHMRIPRTAHAYWKKLVNEYDVVPDRNNFKEILRLMQYNRSSNLAVEMVKFMHSKEGVEPHFSTYRMAMAVLARDWKNRNIVDTVISLLDDMKKHLEYPDVDTLRSILSLITKTFDSAKAIEALERVQDAIARLSPGARTSGDATAVLKQMVGTIDQFLSENREIARDDKKKLNSLRSTANSEIGQLINDRAAQRERRRNNVQSVDTERRKRAPPEVMAGNRVRRLFQSSDGSGLIRRHHSKDISL